eukprot:jgi/Psemu1/10738/gm1.10738_g
MMMMMTTTNETKESSSNNGDGGGNSGSNSGSNSSSKSTATETETADDFAARVADRFDVVCFDMDQCAVRRHSRGRLPRSKSEIDEYAASASPDFASAVPALLGRNVRLAIVTHSDLAEHEPSRPRKGEGAVVLGDDLVHEVLQRVVPDHAHEFFVVAWRPKSRGSEGLRDPGKTRHVRACAAFYGVPLERCVLFDDDPTNCTLTSCSSNNANENANGSCARFEAYQCDPERGFRFADFRESETKPTGQQDYFRECSDGTIDRLNRWETKWNLEYEGNPRFHLPVANPNLVRFHGNRFDPPLNLPILLPLCGKTIDLRWLGEAGHHCVVGVEGVRKGIEELRDELLGDLRKIDGSDGRLWTTAETHDDWFGSTSASDSGDGGGGGCCVSIVCDDFFGLTPENFGGRGRRHREQPFRFGAAYDRGAIVAVPPHSRPHYVEVLDSLLVPGGTILIVTVDTKRGTGGPPFPVTPGVVEELFGTRGYTTELLDAHDAGFGNTGATEYVFLLTKPEHP